MEEENRKIRVAVAEDVEYLRKSICKRIAACPDMELVGEVGTGCEMIAMAMADKPDVILMDIEMEGPESGIQAASAISREWDTVIIVFLTVHEEDTLIYKAFSSAMNVDYIVKSAPHETILKKIRDAYQDRIQIAPEIQKRLTSEFGRMKRNESSLLYFINVMFTITPSERELIRLLLQGETVRQIAKNRYVQPSTVKSQVNTLLKKFHMNRTKDILSLIVLLGVESFFSGKEGETFTDGPSGPRPR